MASREQKTVAKGVIAAIVLVVALFLLLNAKFHWADLRFFGGRENPAVDRELNVLAIDIDTGKAVWVKADATQVFPMKNSSGRETIYRACVCEQDKIIFPARPGVMVQVSPGPSGSSMTGGATKEHENYKVMIPEGFPD